MSKRVASKQKKATTTRSRSGKQKVRVHVGFMLDGDEDELTLKSDSGHPVRLNPETEKEREKRLAVRKALTLRAFQTTYEKRRRKAS